MVARWILYEDDGAFVVVLVRLLLYSAYAVMVWCSLNRYRICTEDDGDYVVVVVWLHQGWSRMGRNGVYIIVVARSILYGVEWRFCGGGSKVTFV